MLSNFTLILFPLFAILYSDNIPKWYKSISNISILFSSIFLVYSWNPVSFLFLYFLIFNKSNLAIVPYDLIIFSTLFIFKDSLFVKSLGSKYLLISSLPFLHPFYQSWNFYKHLELLVHISMPQYLHHISIH